MSPLLKMQGALSALLLVLPCPGRKSCRAQLVYRTCTRWHGKREADPRYQEIKHKSETLMDVTDVFSSLSHARRAARLEWIIIILIAFEIVMALLDKFWRF